MLEILAPCGSAECLSAALNTGADAVYLGLETFSARKNASNFTAKQLCEAVKLCHESGVRVHVALNTLVFDNELEAVASAIGSVAAAKVDALIIQDFAVAKLAAEIAPEIARHASTQMTITSAAGAEFARLHGFSRVVLPRELSFDEIREITSAVDIETEVFVHGALCVCVSGQCLMSAMLGGRSGNRGLCAQPCRLPFKADERENVLSLKDLSLISDLRKLQEAGVTSAKIEGRMKRPEYVAAAVSQCRLALCGDPPDMELLGKIFSRSGFTKGYFDGSFKEMGGIRTKADAEGAPKAMTALHELYKSPYKRFVLDLSAVIKQGEPIICTASCGEMQAAVLGEIPEPSRARDSTAQEISQRLAKLGGTVFEAGEIRCEIDSGLSVSAAEVNRLRRAAVDKITEKIREKIEQTR